MTTILYFIPLGLLILIFVLFAVKGIYDSIGFYGIFVLTFLIISFILFLIGLSKVLAQTTATAHVENNPINICVQVLKDAGYLK